MKTRLAFLAVVLVVVMSTVAPALASTAKHRPPPPTQQQQACINEEMAALNQLASLLGFKKGLKGLAKAYNLSAADIQHAVAADCASQ